MLNNIGRTLILRSYKRYSDKFLTKSNYSDSINDISRKLKENKVSNLISLDVDLTRHIDKFEKLINETNLISLSSYKNELTKLSNLVIPKSHFLESWGVF